MSDLNDEIRELEERSRYALTEGGSRVFLDPSAVLNLISLVRFFGKEIAVSGQSRKDIIEDLFYITAHCGVCGKEFDERKVSVVGSKITVKVFPCPCQKDKK